MHPLVQRSIPVLFLVLLHVTNALELAVNDQGQQRQPLEIDRIC